MVRPIAFKPVVSNKPTSANMSNSSPENCYDKPHTDDGYSSQESRSCSHNGTMRDSYSYDARPNSYEYNHYRDAQDCSNFQATPSPSDSGVSEMEALLREKERELLILRETMEANEKVIFQVNEEKRVSWENQMQELTAEYHRRLRVQQDRSYRTEQELQDHVTQLEKDNQKLLTEKDQLQIQKDRNAHLNDQLKRLKQKNDELSNKLAETACECELLRQQNNERQSQISSMDEQLTVIKAENMNFHNEMDEQRRLAKRQENQEGTNLHTEREIKKLEKFLMERDAIIRAERDRFNADRELWEQEKKKVLKYQKQLQSNYMQMCRRNSELESLYGMNRSQNLNNNNQHHQPAGLPDSFKAQLDSKPESLC